MRRHGWQPPYHPLQVVAIAVFLALAFAFYVFFAPFLGKKLVEYVVVGLYTPLVANVFFLYVWCAAKDPVDDGVLKSEKYFSTIDSNRKDKYREESTVGGSISSLNKENATTTRDNELDKHAQKGKSSNELEKANASFCNMHVCLVLFSWWPVSLTWNCTCACKEYSEKQSTEGGVFYCRLCEAEVCKYSKHCRVCDKCVDGFDHHCRWLNTCIGRKNYWRFFVLMISALLLLFLQFSIGVVVLVDCFLERKRLNVEIASKLGSSFSFVPFVIVTAFCTIMAMVATLPLVQLFFFHVLLIQKGISTYDYIITLREQKPEVGGRQQSQQNSPVSSHTGLSNASSSSTFNRAAWCTPPRLFLEDEFDVVPPENGTNRRMGLDSKNKSNGAIKISPWTLRRMNAEEVSNASALARRKSQNLQPVVRRKTTWKRDTGSSFDGRSGRVASRFDSRRQNKRVRFPSGIAATKFTGHAAERNGIELEPETPMDLDRLWLELTSASWINRATSSAGIFASSSDSSPCSSELHPIHASFFRANESQGPATITSASPDNDKGFTLSRSTSEGYEASGGEDSDRAPTRTMHRSSNWCNLVLNSTHDDKSDVEVATYAAAPQEDRV